MVFIYKSVWEHASASNVQLIKCAKSSFTLLQFGSLVHFQKITTHTLSVFSRLGSSLQCILSKLVIYLIVLVDC